VIHARVGAATTITSRYWVDEDAVTVTSPTVAVADDSGATVVSSATPSGPDVDNTYSALLPAAALASVTTLTATWSATYAGQTITHHDTVDVRGAHYFELGQLRALADLPQRSYTTAQLARARAWIVEKIEIACATSFVAAAHTDDPSRCRIVCHPTRGAAVEVSEPYLRSVRWLRVDGMAVAVADVEVLDGVVAAKVGAANPFVGIAPQVEVGYVAGARLTCPVDLADAAMIAARVHLISKDGASGIPDRATAITNDFGNVSLATPGVRGSIVGIPEVDQTINAWAQRVRTPAIA